MASALRPATGFALPVELESTKGQIIALDVETAVAHQLGPEGYRLEITPDRIVITAWEMAGFFYAGQTLRQLLPPQILGAALAERDWPLPCGVIEDRPRFPFRGVHVDPARHFIPLAELKKIIDGIALLKLNRLQVHFTDDQGWRIPIEPTPQDLAKANAELGPGDAPLTRAEFDALTTVGGRRRETMVGRAYTRFDGEIRYDGTPHEGAYTVAEIEELASYASERHISIVPEIEMLGHMGAAIAANPSLGNYPERQLEVNPRWGVHENILRPTERNIEFLRVVIRKVIEMLRGARYFHIGGDEAPMTEWVATHAVANKREELRRAGRLTAWLEERSLDTEEDLRGYVVRQLAITAGDVAVWDEALDDLGGVPHEHVAVWSWRDVRRGIAAAKADHPVIVAMPDRSYLDRPMTDDPDEPAGQPYVLTLEQVYRFDRDPDPVPADLPPEVARNFQGGVATLWSEHIYDTETLEYFAFSRLPAFAEAMWSARAITQNDAGFADFQRRLPAHKKRLDALGIRHERPESPRLRVRDLPN